jgi:hypothetical protein
MVELHSSKKQVVVELHSFKKKVKMENALKILENFLLKNSTAYLFNSIICSCHLDNADNIIVPNMFKVISEKYNEFGLISMLNLFFADFE